MSKTLYSDLSGETPATAGKLEILEAYSYYIASRDSLGDHRLVRESRERLLEALSRHESYFNFTPKDYVRTVGIEPSGSRIVFPDGMELVLPQEVAANFRAELPRIDPE